MLGTSFERSIAAPYRWRDWGAPGGETRREFQQGESVFRFLERDLLPYLQTVGGPPDASPRQRLISRIIADVDQTRVDTERNFLDVVDLVDRHPPRCRQRPAHVRALRGLRGLAALDGREEQRRGAVLHPARGRARDGARSRTEAPARPCSTRAAAPAASSPKPTSTCVSASAGGAFRHGPRNARGEHLLRAREGQPRLPDRARQSAAARHRRAAHLARQHADRDDGLRRAVRRRGLRSSTSCSPIRRSAARRARTRRRATTTARRPRRCCSCKRSSTVSRPAGARGSSSTRGCCSAPASRAFVQTKQRLLDECDLHCIVSLAPGVFTPAGGWRQDEPPVLQQGPADGADLVLRTHAARSRAVHEDRASHPRPLRRVLRALRRSRRLRAVVGTVTREEIEERNYDLKAVNPHRPDETDTRTPDELLDEIAAHGAELDAALAELREALRP